eukprot:Hpha_TRINITY_DN5121_c0_g2::TRINITY_DN5121_c0_g2_i1::g.192897::m.192897
MPVRSQWSEAPKAVSKGMDVAAGYGRHGAAPAHGRRGRRSSGSSVGDHPGRSSDGGLKALIERLHSRPKKTTSHHLGSVMADLRSKGEHSRALSLMRLARAKLVQLDSVVYNIAMQCAQTPGEALRLFREISEAGLRPNNV